MSQCEPLLRPMPVKRLTAAVVLMVVACIGGYLLTPKWQAVRQEQTRLADPLHAFSDENIQEKQLLFLQSQIQSTGRREMGATRGVLSLAKRVS